APPKARAPVGAVGLITMCGPPPLLQKKPPALVLSTATSATGSTRRRASATRPRWPEPSANSFVRTAGPAAPPPTDGTAGPHLSHRTEEGCAALLAVSSSALSESPALHTGTTRREVNNPRRGGMLPSGGDSVAL